MRIAVAVVTDVRRPIPPAMRPRRCFLRQHGLNLTEANFSCYADHSVAHWSLVREGMGIVKDETLR